MLPDDIAPVRRVLHGKEADIYSCSASGYLNASLFREMYGNYYSWVCDHEIILDTVKMMLILSLIHRRRI